MVMQYFRSDKGELLRLLKKDAATAEQRDALLSQLGDGKHYRFGELLFMFRHADPEICRHALEQIVPRASPAEVVPPLLGIFSTLPLHGQRWEMLLAGLVALDTEIVARRLRPLLADKNPKQQETAYYVLERLPMSSAVAPLWTRASRCLTGPLRWRLVRHLLASELQTTRAFEEECAAIARDPDPEVRAIFLDRLAATKIGKFGSAVLAGLNDPVAKVRRAALGALKLPTARFGLGQLLPLTCKHDSLVRDGVLRKILQHYQSHGGLQRLFEFLSSRASGERDRVFQALAESGRVTLAELLKLLATTRGPARENVAVLALRYDDPRILLPCRILMESEDWWNRVLGMEALGRLGDATHLPLLVEKLADPEASWAAVEAIAQIGGPPGLEILKARLQGSEANQRIDALRALHQHFGVEAHDSYRHLAADDPADSVRAFADWIIKQLEHGPRWNIEPEDCGESGEMDALLAQAAAAGASDLHLVVGEPPLLRIGSRLTTLQAPAMNAEALERLTDSILIPSQQEQLREQHQLDFCWQAADGRRFRGNVFREHKGRSANFRVLWKDVPRSSDLRLPKVLHRIADYRQGMVLFVGPGRCGKSTTLAAVLDTINETRHHHVVCLEDPIEILHPNKNSIVHQRQLHRHTHSFAQGLRAALREDPDVIIVGELRDAETIGIACTASETGHLLLGTLHTTRASKAVDRMIGAFPPEQQERVRSQFADSFKFVVGQVLLERADGAGLVACYEVLRNSTAIANLIRDHKTHLLENQMALERNYGSIPRDVALMELVEQKLVAPYEAYRRATDRTLFERLVPSKLLEDYREE